MAPRFKNRYLVIFIAALIGLFLLDIISSFLVGHSSSDLSSTKTTDAYRNKNVRLFAATPFFGRPIDNSWLSKCSEYCKLVDNSESADAVMYHIPDYRFLSTNELKSNQIAVIWSLESPIYQHLSRELRGRINWTMTYRRDSDVWFPYGVIRKRDKPIQIDYDKIWRDKKRMVVWLVSNCGHANGRLILGRALQKSGLELDIFGACGQHKTPNDCDGVKKQSDQCVAELFMPYMFALSFENSLCKDYITEKFFEVLQKRYAIPIVMRRKDYEHIAAPPNSFIAVDDYKNIDELISDIKTIASNKFTYLKYHRWRESYEIQSDYFHIDDTGFCALCKKLMRQRFSRKHYDDVAAWWNSNEICEIPQDGFVNEFLSKSGMVVPQVR
ncbi:unnamed protein product [Anisakis simplex]|uniref:Fucosyltransferase n=1 Tax=Anisakis simplex TaxID=6269 RepID=A0A0M3JXE3_ANISI|nr:unnamed protein product [Anisakis simplex]